MTTVVSQVLEQYLKQITESLKSNRCAVLVGAGFSRNADSGSLFAPTFPTWNELADTFYEKLHSVKPAGTQYLSPLALAEQVEAAFGRNVLNHLLISRIPDAQYSPSALHTKLLELPWTDIFTTNYDTLLERASQEITSKRFNIINCKEDLVSSVDAPRIVKLHGTFPSHRPFIITSEDYRRYPREFAPLINTVQQSLLENTLCLIGFSGDDPNFNQWIGWIHDNLGIENSPQIYLFTHEDYPDAQKRLLLRKKVVVLDISALAPAGSPRQRYEGLLDYLLDSVHTSQQVWPEELKRDLDEKKSLPDVISHLQSVRNAYPGWLVLPHAIRNRALRLRREIEEYLHRSIKEYQVGELSLLYQYDWLREKCLRPPLQWELEFYQAILARSLGSIVKEEQQMRLSIQLSLLRDLRESGDYEGWKELFGQIQSQPPVMRDDQIHRLSYERCLFSMFNFNYQEMRAHLDAWNVNEYSPEWVLRKSGLLAECNELLQAQELLQHSLVLIRRQLQSNDQSLLLLSYESALMSLKGYIEHAASIGKDFKETGAKPRDTEAERRQKHRMFTTDWHTEDERFQLLLTAPRQDHRSNKEQPSFDFGRRSVSFNDKEDTDSFTAYAFLRFREDTGHPFRIHTVTSAGKAVIGAVERIAPFAFAWAVVTIARANEHKAVEEVLSRAALSKLNASAADELALGYLVALRRTSGEIQAADWLGAKNFAGFTAEVLPLLLSHLCCKCSFSVLEQLLQYLLEIYQSDFRLNYKKLNELTRRLMTAFTTTQKAQQIAVLLKFPLFPDNYRMLYDLSDPMSFLALPIEKPIPCTEVIPGTEEVFVQALSSPELRQAALGRLAVLSCNGWLTQEQDKRLGDLLWQQDGPVMLKSYERTILLMLPHPAEVNPKEVIRALLLADFRDRASDNKASMSNRDSLLYEFGHGVFRGIFTTQDITVILTFCAAMYARLSYHFGKTKFFNADSLARKHWFQMTETLTRLLLSVTGWHPTDQERVLMEQIVEGLRSHGLTHPGLELLWARKCANTISINDKFIAHLFMGSPYQKLALYDTAILAIEYKEQAVLNEDETRFLFTMIAQQIQWRSNEHLVSALNVMHDLFRVAPELLSQEIEAALLIGLQCLLEESNIPNSDETDDAVPKGEIRVAAARLAYRMIHYCNAVSKPVSDTLSQWESVYRSPDEFAEVRNAVN
ncbi:SIR2 family NAD-dependent protein deacylase [Paenibacillus tengchongensis]|uniref:SIR2 family NAD-dependent protein deacylase n=1 Tax=Paenibacillus tengchongensis TaxID=2608684 RepID=UPI00124C4A97|nr:SIR2 family protein [Paenibacillus tengchongensis]